MIILFYLQSNNDLSDINSTFGVALCDKTLRHFRHRWDIATSPQRHKTILTLSLLLAGDIELNPGPVNQKAAVWPCGVCQYPVNWEQEGVACDGCSLWHQRSCLSMCSNDYRDLEGTNVVWLCCMCDSINCDNFTFRSYELQTSNSFHPLTQIDSSIDSVHSSVFSPLHTSSPKNRSNFSNSGKKTSTRSTSSTSSSTYHEPFPDMPKKQNLRIMNINCRSVKENKSEFKVAVDYIKPDIICGYKPDKTPTSDAIKTSEIFPDNYNVFRNDRGILGGGVFIAVQNNISAVECVDFITGCEIEYAKITLKSKKTLYIGSFCMPHRKLSDLDQLESSLNLLMAQNLNS